MAIFWGSMFQLLKRRTQVFLQLMCGKGISEGGFLRAKEKGDAALRRGREVTTLSGSLDRTGPLPLWSIRGRPPGAPRSWREAPWSQRLLGG